MMPASLPASWWCRHVYTSNDVLSLSSRLTIPPQVTSTCSAWHALLMRSVDIQSFGLTGLIALAGGSNMWHGHIAAGPGLSIEP